MRPGGRSSGAPNFPRSATAGAVPPPSQDISRTFRFEPRTMNESIWKNEPGEGGEAPFDCPGAVLVATLGGVILSWNSEAGELLGYSAPEVLGRHVSILLPPDPTVDGIPERVSRGETVRGLKLQ